MIPVIYRYIPGAKHKVKHAFFFYSKTVAVCGRLSSTWQCDTQELRKRDLCGKCTLYLCK